MLITAWKADTAMRELHIKQIKGLFEHDREFEKDMARKRKSLEKHVKTKNEEAINNLKELK